MSSKNSNSKSGESLFAKRPAADAEMSAPTPLMPAATQYRPLGTLPNTPLAASIISAILGGMLFGGLAMVMSAAIRQLGLDRLPSFAWARPQLAAYIAAMGLFHLAEFWTTAGWNPQKLSVDGK